MTDFVALNLAFVRAKKTKEDIAKETRIPIQHIKNGFKGFYEFTPKEIAAVSKSLNLTNEEMENIFYKAD